MHELSVAEAILDRAREAASDHGHDVTDVETLTVELGAATHVNPDQLRFCVEAVAAETPLSGVDVAVERIEARAACECGWRGEPPTFDGAAVAAPAVRCPDCGGRTEFTRGRECRLAGIDIGGTDTPRADR